MVGCVTSAVAPQSVLDPGASNEETPEWFRNSVKLPVSYTSPRKRKSGGSTEAIRAATVFEVTSFDGPSPTAMTVGSLASVHAPGR
jgi:hypothetical protein